MPKGVQISDHKDKAIIVKLSDILEEIDNGNSLYWTILFLDAIGNLGKDRSIVEFQNEIYESKRGFFITWKELIELSCKFYDVYGVLIIGCKDKNLLQRYQADQVMYETCDIVIEMIDSAFWEVFSKNKDLIQRLATKFKEIKFLDPNFEK